MILFRYLNHRSTFVFDMADGPSITDNLWYLYNRKNELRSGDISTLDLDFVLNVFFNNGRLLTYHNCQFANGFKALIENAYM